MTALLKKLTAANAPSGFEDEVRDIIRAEAAPFADEITEDALGNLIVLRKGKQAASKRSPTKKKR